MQQRVKREYVGVEDAARVCYAPNFASSYGIVNRDAPNRWGNPRGYAILPGLSPVHLTAAGSKRLLKNADWAKDNFAVTRRKETEPSSSSMWNMHLAAAPPVDFARFFDGESIEQEDLVLWINVGMRHLPHAEDAPNTKTNVAASSFMLSPLNYFDEDPSMDALNAVVLEAPPSGAPPGTPYAFDDYGVRQDYACIPPPLAPFRYDGEVVVDGHLGAE